MIPCLYDLMLSASELNHDLNVINQWAYQWKMEINPDPNKQATELLFSCKRNSPNHPSLFFNGTVVPKVTIHELQSTSYELQSTSKELQSTSYELQSMSYNPRVTSYNPRVTSYNPRVTSYNPRVTSYNTSYNP